MIVTMKKVKYQSFEVKKDKIVRERMIKRVKWKMKRKNNAPPQKINLES